MATLEVRSVPNLLGTPVSYAYAVKAGPWIFLTGHEAFDFERGVPKRLPAVSRETSSPAWRIQPAASSCAASSSGEYAARCRPMA